MDAIEELLGRSEIRQLAERYAVAVDAKDIDTIASLFVDDAQAGTFGTGRDAVRLRFDHILRSFHCSMHLVANTVVDFDDADHAHGVVYCRVHHHRTEPDHWQDNAMAYFDAYEREDGVWRFRQRKVTTWYRQWVGHPDHGPERVPPDAEPGPHTGRLPDDFPTFEPFWARPPAPLPDPAAPSPG